MFKQLCKRFALAALLLGTASANMMAGGGTNTYYSSLTASATPTGAGTVYASSAAVEDLSTVEFAETSSATMSGTTQAHKYYIYTKPAAGHKFMAWFSNEECTTLAKTTATETGHTYQFNGSTTEGRVANSIWARFVTEDTYTHSSCTARVVGLDGEVSVYMGEPTGVYGTESTASSHNTLDLTHTYMLSARSSEEANTYFVGWFSDEACTQLLSTKSEYSVSTSYPSLSLDAASTTELKVYALFSSKYQVKNGGFELWTGSEPAPGWNSFPSAVGSMAGTGKGMSPNPERVEGRGEEGYAVRLYSKFAGTMGIGANANGNLTTGRVNMGSMTPDDQSNHNFSDTENEGYYLVIAGQPDGVEFYSKYKMGDGDEHQGHAQFILHDEFNYIDPQREEQVEHRIGQAETFIPESEEWELQTAEFQYDWTKEQAAATKKYLLINFTTNIKPGGSKGDELTLDDVRLIYRSELTGAKYNGEDITFSEGTATIDALYDETLLTDLTSNGRGASIETDYNEETGVLTITVKGEDYLHNTANVHEYTVQFNTPEPTVFEAQLQYNAEDNTVSITVNDETVQYFAMVDTKNYIEFSYTSDLEAMKDAAQYTSRTMKGSQNISANTIYKDAYYYIDMMINEDYYFMLMPCTVEDGVITPVEDAPIFKLEFYYGNEGEFTFQDNGDDTFTVTPITNTLNWYAAIVTEEELQSFGEEFQESTALAQYCGYLTSMDDTYNGSRTLYANELYKAQRNGASITAGKYVVLVGYVESFSEEDFFIICPVGAERYDYVQHTSTGVGTVLRREESDAMYNLQGRHINAQTKGIIIQRGKKVIK